MPTKILRGTGLLDGATSLNEAAKKLRDEADYFDQLHSEGWTVEESAGDYMHLTKRQQSCVAR